MRSVEILSSPPGADRKVLDALWDGHNKYADVVRPDYAVYNTLAVRESAAKTAAWMLAQEGDPHASRDAFDLDWPRRYEELLQRSRRSQPIMGVLDTGVLSRHPRIREILDDARNFTGAPSAEDDNGHGTTCAILLTHDFPNCRLRSGKVVDANGFGEDRSIIEGLEWFASMTAAEDQQVILNMSIGQYSTKWWGGACKGTCKICVAAIECARSGVRIFCAAGNEPGKVACPATVSYYREDFLNSSNLFIMGVGSYDFDGGMSSFKESGKVGYGPLRDWNAS